MKTPAKISILVASLSGFFLLFLILNLFIHLREQKLFMESKRANDNMVVGKVLELKSAAYIRPIKDNAAWDEMVRFTYSRNPQWGNENLLALLHNFDLSYIGVFDVSGNPLFQVTDSITPPFLLESQEVRKFFQGTTVCHGFKLYQGRIFEIFGASIVPTPDVQRVTKGNGFLVAANEWSSDYQEELSKATGFTMSTILASEKIPFTSNDLNGIILKRLTNVSGQNIATIVFRMEDRMASELNFMRYLIIAGITILAILFVVFIYFTRRLVTQPINALQKGLKQGDSPLFRKLLQKNNEFGDMARLILQFDQQKSKLIQEMEERIRAEKYVHKLSSAIEKSSSSVMITDENGVIEFVNLRLIEVTGFSSKEAIGKKPDIFKSGIHPAEFYAELWQTIATGKEWKGEICNKKKDGTLFWESARINSIKNTEGAIINYIAIKEDITQKKIAETELQEAKEFAELIYNVTPSAIFTVDQEQKITSWNKMVEKLTGYTRDEMIGQDCRTFALKPCTEMCGLYESSIIKPIYSRECTIRTKDGRVLTVSKNVDMLRDLNGNVIGGIESFEDITERITAQNALKESEQRYSTLVNQLPDVVLIHRDGKVIYVNEAAINAFGYTKDEMIGSSVLDYVVEEDRDKLVEVMTERSAGRGDIADYELRGYTKDKQVRDVIIRTDKIMFDGIPAIISILIDVTEWKKYQGILKLAKEEAEKANKAKSEFLAIMSHEIRTPLNGVIGMTELALTTNLTNSQRDYLDSIQTSAYLLLDTINDILDFSKIEAGKLDIERVEFNLRDVVERSVEILTVKAFEKNLELLCEIEPDLPAFLFGDPLRIRQILVNFISNAIKFTDQGEIFISVRNCTASEQESGKTCISFSVKDTGIGISEENQKAIFNRFTQADTSTTRKYGGTGLGLSIAKKLTEMMGGSIHLHSETGVGSTFYIRLPLGISDKRKEDFKTVATPRIRKVLVLDDNKTNLKIMGDMLSYWGISSFLTSDGEEAVKIFSHANSSSIPFDFVILDMHMPGMNGLTVAKKIRECSGTTNGPMIFMYSSVEKENIQNASKEVGIDKFLTKPVKMKDLWELIRTGIKPAESSVAVSAKSDADIIRFSSETTILIAEDNAINAKLLNIMLAKTGATVLCAVNGLEAVEMYQAYSVQMIFMDVHMPEMDGFQATRKIREIEGSGRHTPIIALTAIAMEGDREKCLENGMDDYLSKPFKKEDLFMILKKYLQSVV